MDNKELKKVLNLIRHSVSAGICIGIGCTVYLMAPNKILGAFLFTIGLFVICWFNLYLYTGKIGYVLRKHNLLDCILILMGNLIGITLLSIVVRLAIPRIELLAYEVVQMKLEQSYISCICRAIMCGILMYIAVENFRVQRSVISKSLGIALCVPVFILCGFEHSIADFGYIMLSHHDLPVKSLVYILLVIVFNGLGSIFISSLLGERKNVR